MPDTVSELYAALVAAGEIERDPAQEAIAARLTRLNARMAEHRLAREVRPAFDWKQLPTKPRRNVGMPTSCGFFPTDRGLSS